MELISNILSSIIVLVTPLLFVKILLNCNMRKNKIRIVIACVISIVLSILSYYCTNGITRSILVILIYTLLIIQIYKISLKNTVICVVVCMILLMIPDFLFLCSCIYLFGFTKEYCYNVLAGSLLSNLIVYGSMIPLTIMLRKPLRKLLNVKLDYNKKVIIISILTLISVLVFFFDIVASVRIGAKIILYIIAIVTFVAILIFLIHEENKNTQLKVEYEKLLEFMQTYEVELEKERILKHEHKNELITIKSKIIDKDSESNIVGYIDELLGDEARFSQEGYTQFQYLPPNGIKALFYFKVSAAKKKGINTSINIAPSIQDSILKDLSVKQFKDLGVLIGVYLDNAIEASEISQKKVLGIEMYDVGNNVEIIISNSYVGSIDENKVGKTQFSTKGKNRGHGLLLVKQTLMKNNKIKSQREITTDLYIQIITIEK